jgi:hypothetical protein
MLMRYSASVANLLPDTTPASGLTLTTSTVFFALAASKA